MPSSLLDLTSNANTTLGLDVENTFPGPGGSAAAHIRIGTNLGSSVYGLIQVGNGGFGDLNARNRLLIQSYNGLDGVTISARSTSVDDIRFHTGSQGIVTMIQLELVTHQEAHGTVLLTMSGYITGH